MSDPLPPCGLYRTVTTVAGIPPGRLVLFHSHGDPGPGLYLPESWRRNRAVFQKKGATLPEPSAAKGLQALLAEGLYRVEETFTCCDKACRKFERDLLVQLGYDGSARPILFVPEWTDAGLGFPEIGQAVDEPRLAKLGWLLVPTGKGAPATDHH